MQHIIMTCLNHRNLRWSCKEIAVTADGRFNGCRNIFFCGTVEQMENNEPENMADECNCSSTDLRSLASLNS